MKPKTLSQILDNPKKVAILACIGMQETSVKEIVETLRMDGIGTTAMFVIKTAGEAKRAGLDIESTHRTVKFNSIKGAKSRIEEAFSNLALLE